jgi:hypothetical protein
MAKEKKVSWTKGAVKAGQYYPKVEYYSSIESNFVLNIIAANLP